MAVLVSWEKKCVILNDFLSNLERKKTKGMIEVCGKRYNILGKGEAFAP
jgi:hypothetical protein